MRGEVVLGAAIGASEWVAGAGAEVGAGAGRVDPPAADVP